MFSKQVQVSDAIQKFSATQKRPRSESPNKVPDEDGLEPSPPSPKKLKAPVPKAEEVDDDEIVITEGKSSPKKEDPDTSSSKTVPGKRKPQKKPRNANGGVSSGKITSFFNRT